MGGNDVYKVLKTDYIIGNSLCVQLIQKAAGLLIKVNFGKVGEP